MEHSPSWKVNNCSAGHEIPCIFWNIKFHYQVYRSLLLAHKLEDSSPCPPSLCLRYILIFSFISLPVGHFFFFFLVFPTKNLYVWIFHFPHVCHILHPSHGLDLITIIVQVHCFIWQLSVPASHWLMYCINTTHSANCPHTLQGSNKQWQMAVVWNTEDPWS